MLITINNKSNYDEQQVNSHSHKQILCSYASNLGIITINHAIFLLNTYLCIVHLKRVTVNIIILQYTFNTRLILSFEINLISIGKDKPHFDTLSDVQLSCSRSIIIMEVHETSNFLPQNSPSHQITRLYYRGWSVSSICENKNYSMFLNVI